MLEEDIYPSQLSVKAKVKWSLVDIRTVNETSCSSLLDHWLCLAPFCNQPQAQLQPRIVQKLARLYVII
jgi:hypothetical protein